MNSYSVDSLSQYDANLIYIFKKTKLYTQGWWKWKRVKGLQSAMAISVSVPPTKAVLYHAALFYINDKGKEKPSPTFYFFWFMYLSIKHPL